MSLRVVLEMGLATSEFRSRRSRLDGTELAGEIIGSAQVCMYADNGNDYAKIEMKSGGSWR